MASSNEGSTLIYRIAAGDEAAAIEFESLYRSRLERFARGRGVPPQELDDLLQDVFLAVVTTARAEGYRGVSALGTWVTAILKNKIADYWRANKNREGPSVDGDDRFFATTSLESIRHHAANIDLTIDLYRTLDRLPNLHRVILLLNTTEQYTTNEIAAILKMKSGSVGRKLAEAKNMVRQALADEALLQRVQLRAKKSAETND